MTGSREQTAQTSRSGRLQHERSVAPSPIRFCLAMATSTNQVTIDEALDRFLADQRERLSEKTFRRYQDVVQLLRHSLDGYAYTLAG